MKNIFRLFGLRVAMAVVATILAVVVLSDFMLCRFAYQSQLEGTRERLKMIAQTAALVVDANKIMAIPLSKEGMNTQAYAYTNDQLKKIRIANPLIKYIYILTKVDRTNIWRFVVDPDSNERNGKHSYPGDSYDAGRFPEMLKAFDQASADKKIEQDEWGKTLSGYAPIRDALGRPVAVLGVDMSAEDVYAIYDQARNRVLVILLIGVILAVGVGLFVSSRVVGPINQLIAGTRYIAQGNLHHQVHVSGDDEISELAGSFNTMAQSLEESRRKLVNYFYDTVKSLVLILEIRDHYTMGHSESVAHYSEKIAKRMGIDQKTMETFKRVALLHDIGKVGVRDSVLLKTDKLSDEEWEAIKRHPVLGEQILKPILNDASMLSVIRNHHERYDGQGYPDGFGRGQIPLLTAIVTVADSYDAMTSCRAYRKAMSQEQAIEQLKKGRGSQFRPDVVDAFLKILEEERASIS